MDITHPFTISAWISAQGSDTYNVIVDKYANSGGYSYGYTFYLNDGKLRFTIYSGPQGSTNLFGVTDLRNTGWHHVQAEYDGSSILVYVDGIL